ncbi:hypothetical protein PT277_03430 [Acetobacteraceae bacterium ESL0709]|nr:hypothetical protein [Acetobacteraceae bacterium ESL0709]
MKPGYRRWLFRAETDITGTDTPPCCMLPPSPLAAMPAFQSTLESHVAIPQSEEAPLCPRLQRETANRLGAFCYARLTNQILRFYALAGNFTILENRSSASVLQTLSMTMIHRRKPGTTLMIIHYSLRQGHPALERLQKPGRSMMEADAFLRGCPIPKGTHFE